MSNRTVIPGRVDIFAFSDCRGGAAKAALSQFRAISSGVEANFFVAEKHANIPESIGPTRLEASIHILERFFSYVLNRLQRTSNPSKHSLNLFSSPFFVRRIRESKAQVFHFHWINNDCLSIKHLYEFLLSHGDTRVIITLHDEWLFAGSEHLIADKSERYIYGYSSENSDVKGIDLDRWTFERKLNLKALLERSNVAITLPSTYMKKRAKESKLLGNCSLEVVGNTIDVNMFRPMTKAACRVRFEVDDDAFVMLFGAAEGGSYLKGYDLLEEALKYIETNDTRPVILLSFGKGEKVSIEKNGIICRNLGFIDSREELAAVYNCADFTVVPSRVESFGQVAAESLACGTPTIAFNNSGLTDVVEDSVSGYLVEAFNVQLYGDAINKALKLSSDEIKDMARLGREHIVNNYSANALKAKWQRIYFN